jgi:hypothetical protein
MNWTKELPKKSGWYWYRESYDSYHMIVEWDEDMQWFMSCGNDIPVGNDMQHKITGEFWPVELLPP